MKSVFTSKQISIIRKFTGLTQREFGVRVGVSQRQVSAWESGDALIGVSQARRIVAVFDLLPENFDFEFPKITDREIFFDFKTGDDVHAFRIDRGLSQNEFARQVGVTPITVSSWERKGARALPANASDKIVIGFGLNASINYRERVARIQQQIGKIPPEYLDALELIILGLTRERVAKI